MIILKRCVTVFKARGRNVGQGAIDVYAGAHEVCHVILNGLDHFPCYGAWFLRHDVVGPEVFLRRSRIIHDDSFGVCTVRPHEVPHVVDFLFGAGKFEVVNVDDEEQFLGFVIVAAVPSCDLFESEFEEVGFTVFFPISSGVRVSVQGQLEPANRIMIFSVPVLGPSTFGQGDPCVCAEEVGLSINTFGVTVL